MKINQTTILWIVVSMLFIALVATFYYEPKQEPCEQTVCPAYEACKECEECEVCEVCPEVEEIKLSQREITTCSRESKSPQDCEVIRKTQTGYESVGTTLCKADEYGHTYANGNCVCKLRQCPIKNWEE